MITINGEKELVRVESWADIEKLSEAVRDRLTRYAAHTGGWNLDADFTDTLLATIERYNTFAASGVDDEDFHRGEAAIERYFNMGGRPGNDRNETMWPISSSGPYYATLLCPATLDTEGGPRANAHGQVLTRTGDTIPGLYAVGNCAGAMSAGSYWAGGATLGPIITMAWLAGRDAARQPVRSPDAAIAA